MIKYTLTVTEQFVRDRRMVLHAQNEADLVIRLEDMIAGIGRRFEADESEIVGYVIEDEKTVL